MKIIVITSPETIPGEAVLITRLLDGGIDYIHIRKPGASLRDVKNLIEEIPIQHRSKLRLHGHFESLNEFNLAGVQLNSRCPIAPATALTVSKSCHSIDELADADRYEYVTLSPIFNSISKDGYNSKFRLENLSSCIKCKKIVALGGVKPENFLQLKNIGFWGAALLGYVWNNPTINHIDNVINEINNNR